MTICELTKLLCQYPGSAKVLINWTDNAYELTKDHLELKEVHLVKHEDVAYIAKDGKNCLIIG